MERDSEHREADPKGAERGRTETGPVRAEPGYGEVDLGPGPIESSVEPIRYTPPPDLGGPLFHVSYRRQTEGAPATDEQRLPFQDRLEIGRRQRDREAPPGTLAIDDPTVSRRHCVLSRTEDGCCLLRDLSRNGTWLDGRRLMPGAEVEIRPGQEISVGNGHIFRLEGEGSAEAAGDRAEDSFRTVSITGASLVTVLVGDIRDYTTIMRHVPIDELQRSVSRVFQRLEEVVVAHGGTIKEYPGDALFAFWDYRVEGPHAGTACRAALALRAEVARMAADPSVWLIPGFTLHMDWAITTGLASTKSIGGDHPTGLSMVGEPVVLAFRLEKLADEGTGSIILCSVTRAMAGEGFDFRDLGSVAAKGFDEPVKAFALLGARGGSS